jgi:hypothetical protein
VSEDQLSAEDLTPREQRAFIASCQLKDRSPEAVMFDAEYADELEQLAEFGWLEQVIGEDEDGERVLFGYRLSPAARIADETQSLVEERRN